MGGDFALMMAPRKGVSAASVNYGGATDAVEDALPEVCPIVGSFGGRDRWPGMQRVPDRLESMLETAGVEHEIKVYPDAGHGFLNDHDPAQLPLWIKAIAKLANASYDESAARDARRRITESSRYISSPDVPVLRTGGAPLEVAYRVIRPAARTG